MPSYRQTNEGGSNGTTVGGGTGGTVDGSTAYDTASQVAGGTLAFDTTHSLFGGASLGVKVVTGGTAGQSMVTWTTSLTYAVPFYTSLCLYFTANPTVTTRFCNILTGSTLMCGASVTTAGKFTIINSAGTIITTSTSTIATGAFFRVELALLAASATVGQAELRYFSDPFSAVPTETLTTTAAQNTSTGTPTEVRFGMVVNTASAGPYWMDEAQASTVGYPPPPRWQRTPLTSTLRGSSLLRATTF